MPPAREKLDAQNAVARALASGAMPTPTACEACGREQYREKDGRNGVQAHHHSYLPEHHLDVIPLCRSCHHKVHNGSLPEPRTGRVYTNPKSNRVEDLRPAVLRALAGFDRPATCDEVFAACPEAHGVSRRGRGFSYGWRESVGSALSAERKAGRVEKIGATFGTRWRLAVPA